MPGTLREFLSYIQCGGWARLARPSRLEQFDTSTVPTCSFEIVNTFVPQASNLQSIDDAKRADLTSL